VEEGKMLTAKMKAVTTSTRLIDLLDGVVDRLVFNKFHASAAYHSLATWKRKRRLQTNDRASSVLERLHQRVGKMIYDKKLGPREGANVFWAAAHLVDAVPNVTQLVPPLVKVLPKQMSGMNAQELSNSLWAVAQMQETEPSVLRLVPAVVAQIPSKVADMIPQHLSNCFWASAQLRDTEPTVLKVVPLITQEIQQLALTKSLIPQHLSNCLWAVAQLKDLEPSVLDLVPVLTDQIIQKAEDMIPQALSSTLLAAAQLQELKPEVLQVVPAVVAQLPLMADRMSPQAFANCLAALILLQQSIPDVQNVLADRRGLLMMAARRFTEMLPTMTRTSDLHLAVPTVVWACARMGVYHGELLISVAERLGSKSKVSGLPDWGLCVLAWSYQVLDQEERFSDFFEKLVEEIDIRQFSDSQVERSQLGSWEWQLDDDSDDSGDSKTSEGSEKYEMSEMQIGTMIGPVRP